MIGMLLPNHSVTKKVGAIILENESTKREGKPYWIVVIVLLTLSASAIAMAARESSLFPPKLQR